MRADAGAALKRVWTSRRSPAFQQRPEASAAPHAGATRAPGYDAARPLISPSPEESAAHGLTGPQRTALIGAAVFAAGVAIAAPALAWIALQIGSAALFLAAIGFRLAAALTALRSAPRRRLDESELPRFTLIVALYREAGVVAPLARALAALRYPADRLEVKFAVEAGDAPTIAALRTLALDARFETVIVPPGAPRTKPRALNHALRFASGDIVTVYDAEDRPDPGQLRAAAEAFAAGGERLACVQAPLVWYNARQNWLTRQFALEYAAHFYAVLPLLACLNWPLPLGGTSNHVRRSALIELGGWDAWNVTEDADLGFRLARAGYRTAMIAPPTGEEAVCALAPWVRQRTRWLKGHAQTFGVQTRAPGELARTAGPGGPASLGLTLGATLLCALLHLPAALFCLGAALAACLRGDPAAAAPAGFLLAGYGAAAWLSAVGAKRAGFQPRQRDLLTLPLYWPLQTIAAWRALRELAVAPFFWDKTEHGICPAPDTPCRSTSRPPSSCLPPRSACSPWRPGAAAANRTPRRARA